MSLILFFAYIAFSHHGSTAPVVPQPTSTVGWVSEPNGRGTFGLVTSCLFTLSICVWSSMHLNVPPKTRSTLWRWIDNFKWTGLGILGPELIVWIAWRQYSSAKVLSQHSKESNGREAHENPRQSRIEALKSTPSQENRKEHEDRDERYDADCEPPPLKRSWSLVQGFYASMGGFVFDASSPTIREIIPYNENRPYLTITAKGLQLLGECGHLPDIDEEDIKDKSKSDGLTKLIAVFQAAWMIVQIVGRVVSNQPVTLLEVNTMSHVLIAFAIYLLWWHKPQWISEPTKLEGEWVKPLAAYMYMSSHISGWRESKRHLLRGKPNEPELEALEYHPPERPQNLLQTPSKPSNLGIVKARTISASSDLEKYDSTRSYRPHFVHSSTFSSSSKNLGILSRRSSDPKDITSVHHGSIDPLSVTDLVRVRRWDAATLALAQYPNLLEDHFHKIGNVPNTYHADLAEYLCPAIGNWPTPGLLQHVNGLLMGTASWFASVAFGAVNLSAWNAYFPSTAERWLWRSASLWIISSGTIWVIINASARLNRRIDRYWEKILNLEAHWWDYAWIATMCAIAGLFYVGSRLFLVIEAFLSLRSLPPGAYLTPDWSNLLPHLN